MTDKLIATDGTSSGLSAGAAISDTDYLELQQSVVSPASTVNSQFSAVWTWILAKITANASTVKTDLALTKTDVGLGNVANSLQLVAASNLSDLTSAATARVNLGFNQPVRGAYVNGQWQFVDFAGFGASSVVGASTMRLTPFYVKQACHITDIAVNVATANAGDNVQFAIYAADATTNKPTGSVLSSTPNVSVAATGRVSGTLSASVAVTPGLYWLASQCSSATPALQIMTSAGVPFTLDVGNATLAGLWPLSTTLNGGYQVTGQTFGTWPSLSAASFADSLGIVYAYKVSVP